MKKALLFFLFMYSGSLIWGQAFFNQNWTLKDLKGNTHTLYDYLDAGKVVIIHDVEYNAQYHWAFHTSGILDELYEKYGPDGTDQLMVFFAHEFGHADVPDAYFYGNGGNSAGNWVDAVDYPGININREFNWDANFGTGGRFNSYCHMKVICPNRQTVFCNHDFIRNYPSNAVEVLEDYMFGCEQIIGPKPSFEVTNVDCPNDETGSIVLDLSGSTLPVTVYWSNTEQTDGSLHNVPAGEYFATIVDGDNRYRAIGPMIVESNSEGIEVELDNILDADCDGTLGTISINVTKGTAKDYIWSNGSTSKNQENLEAGTYSVTVVDENGCEDVLEDLVINNKKQPSAIATGFEMNCNDSDFTIDGTASIVNANDVILWTTPDGNIVSNEEGLMPIINQSGTYILTISSPEGCSSSTTLNITPPEFPTINSIQTPEILTCDQSCTTLNVDADILNEYSISWTSTNGIIGNGENTLSPEICSPGLYEIVITNPNTGCSSTETIEVTQDIEQPSIEITGETEINCILTEVELTGNSTNQVSYLWSDGSTNSNIAVTESGEYTLVVTHSENGCTNTATINISSSTDLPNFSLLANPINCNNTETILTLTTDQDDLTYNWSGPNGFTSNLQNPATNESGTYQVEVNNSAGCITISSLEVIEDTEISEITIESAVLDCNHSTLELIINGGNSNLTYEWTTTDGHFIANADQSSPTIDQAGLYLLTATNSENGCSYSTEIEISQIPNIDVEVGTIVHPQCNGDQSGNVEIIVTSGSSPYNFEWSNGSNQNSLSDVPSGSYELTVTDAIGCSTDLSVEILQPEPLNAEISSLGESIFEATDGSAMVSVTGGKMPYEYEWSNGETSSEINSLTPDTYIVTITDDNGCITIKEIVVSGIDCDVNGHIEIDHITCFDLSNGKAKIIMESGEEPFIYEWSNDANTSEISDLSVNNYSVTVNDAKGCSFITQVEITQPNALEISTEINPILCNGDNDGSITIEPMGGTPPYSYEWKYGATTQTITDKEPGTYEVNISDSKSCQITIPITISEPEAIILTEQITNISTFGKENGMISVSIDGGTEPYTYAWSNGATSASIDQLSKGEYSILITDENGCTSTNTYTITEPGEVLSTIEGTSISCFGVNDGSVTATIVQGEAPFLYLWSTDETTATITNLSPGTYAVTITDATGGVSENSFTVLNAEQVSSFIVTENVTCFGDNNGSGTVLQTTGGVPPYEYAWENGTTGEKVIELVAGNYKLTITDAEGCESQNSIVIFTPDEFNPNEIITELNDNQQADIHLEPTGGTSPYKYLWSDGTVNKEIKNLAEGTYSVTITDSNDCEYIYEFEILGTVSSTTLIKDYNIQIYPNPTDGLFYLDIDVQKNEILHFELWSITGQKINATIEELKQQSKYKIQIQDGTSSIIIFKIIFEDGVYTQKIKQIW